MQRLHLLGALEELGKYDFEKFKFLLKVEAEARQLPRIPQNQLDSASRTDLAALVTQSFAGDWLPLTLAVLERLPNLVVARELQRAVEGGGASGRTVPLEAPARAEAGARPAEGRHFVDQHREAIVSGVSLVPPILDRLYGLDLLTTEKCDVVKEEKTAQAQMRQLYSYVNSWCPDDKEKFYQALLKLEGPLIRKLGGM